MKRQYIIGSALILSMAWGCKSGEIVEDQSLDIPLDYHYAEDSSGTMAEENWNLFFEDEKLKRLISTALQSNQDVLKTMERIQIATIQMTQGKKAWLPTVNGMLGASQKKFGDYTMDGVGNYDTNFSENLTEDQHIPDPYRNFAIGADFSWELDLWGKFKQKKKAAVARWLGSQQAANLVKTQLISKVAKLYYKMVGLDEEIIILSKNIAHQEMAYQLSKDLKDSGKETQLAVDQFEAQLLNSKSLLIQRERELRSAEIALMSLLGTYEEGLQRTTLSQVDFVPEIIHLGVPANLLQRRPDIQQAEMELQATKADAMSARAAFFPSIRLFGSAGFNAFEFSKLFLSPASTFYEAGAGLMAPLFNKGQIRASFEQAKASQRIAFLDYEQTALNAYLEVLDMVNRYSSLDSQLRLKTDEVLVLRRSISNANTMFSVGYANYLDVINSQNRALEAELDYVGLKTQKLQSLVDLYKALGGSMSEPVLEEPAEGAS
ncbi:RND transporter [Echinicola pacifica]|uniref:RND transporter n=1 Tax=Echinicola pacifica TaxID=346377 RepID=A0A918UJ64_9BACT|nr:TolC family protein [Echinicola pacifica]GGZ14074.1 RND transporter [Echinicola pacifica]